MNIFVKDKNKNGLEDGLNFVLFKDNNVIKSSSDVNVIKDYALSLKDGDNLVIKTYDNYSGDLLAENFADAEDFTKINVISFLYDESDL